MSKPLLGGSAAVAVLLSASMLFLAQTSVAEPLGQVSLETQQKGVAAEMITPGDEAPQTKGSAFDTNEGKADVADAIEAAFDKMEPGAENEASSSTVTFTATAYSLRGRTADGGAVRRGVIAADRRVLPIGTRVRLEAGSYSGEYVVADTGGAVRGRKIDIWVPSTGEAMRFGRRPIKLTVLTRTRPRTTNPRAVGKKTGE
jgi:3D (Asp-Asp-Asp) domain-containing protein